MPTRALVSVEEYLNTSFHPDCDYVDGRVVERNLGELDHSDLQGKIVVYFRLLRKGWGRVPDVCVRVRAKPTEQIFRTPPFLAIEILSKKDRMQDIQERVADYLAFGVRYVWVIDPRSQEGWVHTSAGVEKAKDGIPRTQDPALEMSLPEILAALR